MEVGGERYATVGGAHVVPVAGVDGRLVLCGLDAIGPDPVALLTQVGADTAVCLQTREEIEPRHPAYLDWMEAPGPYEVHHLPTEDHLVADDETVTQLVALIVDQLRRGRSVVVQCGAGWGRAGVVAVLVMCAAGAEIDPAIRDLRLARPAAGPQSGDQDLQIDRLAATVRDSAERSRDPLP